jgi:predicted secreted protein
MRAAAGVVAALLLAPLPALAGDYAERQILGFSPNGRYFAFEEYGVEDGSGFPYSTFYVIDTVDDAWIPGTPIRVNPQDDQVTLDTARGEARKRARAVLADRSIGQEGFLVVSNPPTELSSDPHMVHFRASPWYNSGPSSWYLTLTLLPFPDAPPCENLGPVQGFRLVLADDDGRTWTLQDDKSIPASRGCPQDYAITDVITYFRDGYFPTMVVLVSKFSQGFEGLDRRFIAVAGEFEGQ